MTRSWRKGRCRACVLPPLVASYGPQPLLQLSEHRGGSGELVPPDLGSRRLDLSLLWPDLSHGQQPVCRLAGALRTPQRLRGGSGEEGVVGEHVDCPPPERGSEKEGVAGPSEVEQCAACGRRSN